VVRDATSGEPISGATIVVQSEGGFCEGGKKEVFALVTDQAGSVKRLSKNCMCFGTKGEGGIDTVSVHLPDWIFQCKAEGYASSGFLTLDDLEYRQQVQRGNPVTKLVVPINLKKKDAAPGPKADGVKSSEKI